MKNTAIFSLLIINSFIGSSQDTLLKMDNYYELHRALKNSDADSTRVKNLLNLAVSYQFSRPDSAIYYATRGFELAKDIGDKEQELRALGPLAMAHESLGNSITAYRIALENLRKAEEDNPDLKGNIYRSLGTITRGIQNFEASLEYYRKSKDEFYRINNQGSVSTIYASLGEVHGELGNIDSAFYYGYRAIALAESTNKPVPMDVAYDRMGDIHRNIQNIDSALYYYQLSYSTRSERRRNPFLLRKIASMHALQEQPDSALYYAEKSLNRALTNRLYEDVAESALFFSDFYEKSDPSKALHYNKMALAYQDSLNFMSRMTGFADLTNFDELLRQSELERANKAYQAKLRTNTFIGSVFTLLIIAFLLYRNNRANHKAKLQIEGAYHQLKSTQDQLIHSEKMASLGELTAGIAHEIQNPLNFVNNFSELNQELADDLEEELNKGDIEEAKSIAKDIKANELKITHHGKRADAIVKGMLAHSRTSSGEKVPTDINALADEYLRLAYHGLKAKDQSFNADFKTELDPQLPKVNIIPQDIGRVLLNLINNAFQAVSEVENPMVKVTTLRTENGVQIRISDNGPGIPDAIKDKIFQPFFTTKPTGQGTGLGLSLSYDIVKAHGGEIIFDKNKPEGTTFSIKLPLNQ